MFLRFSAGKRHIASNRCSRLVRGLQLAIFVVGILPLHAHATERREPQPAMTAHKKTPDLPGFAGCCDYMQRTEMAGTGFEVPRDNTGITQLLPESGAESGALGAQKPAFDTSTAPELARLIAAWPSLSGATRAQLIALIDAEQPEASR